MVEVVVVLVVVVGIGQRMPAGWRRQRRMNFVGGKVTTFFSPTDTVTVSGTQAGTGEQGSTKVQTPLQVWSASHTGRHSPAMGMRHRLWTRTPSMQVE